MKAGWPKLVIKLLIESPEIIQNEATNRFSRRKFGLSVPIKLLHWP